MENSNPNSNSFLSIPIPIPFYQFLFKAELNPTDNLSLALSQWLNFLCNWVKNYVLKTGILDQEIGSHPYDSINKKTCQATEHYSEISLGPKLIVD